MVFQRQRAWGSKVLLRVMEGGKQGLGQGGKGPSWAWRSRVAGRNGLGIEGIAQGRTEQGQLQLLTAHPTHDGRRGLCSIMCLPFPAQEFNLKHDEGQDLSKTAIGGMLDGTKSTYDLASTLQTQTRTLFATGTQRVDQTAKQVR